MSWQKEVDELQRRMEMARLMGGRENVGRQHAAGRLTVRERVDQLLDPGTAHGNAQGLNLRYEWASGDWGSLPIEGGVREIEAAPDPAARRREIEERLQQYRSPFRTAEAFGVEEIIDPRDTRPLLCEWVETAYSLLPAELGPKRRKTRT